MSTVEATEIYKKALKAQKNQEYALAEKLYRKSLEIRPDFKQSWQNLGTILSSLKRHQEAIETYEQALEYGEEAALYFNIGSEKCRLNEYEDATKYLKKALKIDSRMLRAHLLMAYALEKSKQNEKARIYFKNAFIIDPTNRLAVLGHALALSETEDYEPGLQAVNTYLRHHPDDYQIKNLRAGFLAHLNRFRETLQDLKDVTEHSHSFTKFTDHIKNAKAAKQEEHDSFFEDLKQRMNRKKAEVRQKLESRKDSLPESADSQETKQENIKDMVDLSFMHLFNGESEQALKFLIQAQKINSEIEKK